MRSIVLVLAAFLAVLTIHTIESRSASAAGGLDIITVAGDCDDSGYPIIRVTVSNPSPRTVSTLLELSLYEQYTRGDGFELVEPATIAVPITVDGGETKDLEHVFPFVEPKAHWKVAANEVKTPSFGPCFVFETPGLPSPTVQPTPVPTAAVDCCAAVSTPYPTATVVVVTPASLPVTGGDPTVETSDDLVAAGLFLGILFAAFGFTLWVMSFLNARRW